MFSGAQVRNKMKTRRIRRQKPQTIVSYVTWAKEAHKPDQTDQPSPSTDHLTSGPTRQCTRERQWPEAARWGRPNQGFGRTQTSTCPGAFWWEGWSYPPDGGLACFHVWRWREPTSTSYIKGLTYHLPQTPLEGLSLTLFCDLYSWKHRSLKTTVELG